MALINLFALATFLIIQATQSHSLNSEGLALLALKSAITTDPTKTLKTWSPYHPNPCHWLGVKCVNLRVTELLLPSLGLTGYIPSELGLLNSLQILILRNNSFYKTIPPRLFNATSLTHVDFSSNLLTGPVPIGIESLTCLTSVDFSSNRLNGTLPERLADLSGLVGTVNFSCNEFEGRIPASYGKFPVKVSLDLRHNKLFGEIPQIGSLLNQGPTAFAGNPGLCGFPLRNRCPEVKDRSINSSTENPLSAANPKLPIAAEEGDVSDSSRSKTGTVVTMAVPIISGVSIVVAAVSISVWIFNKKQRRWSGKNDEGKIGKMSPNKEELEDPMTYDEGQNSKFVVLDEGFNLELEDLLRASAFVLGKSKGGIVYKVVCGGGAQVAVRRLSESDNVWKFKEFAAEVEAIGKVQHPNLVRLRAYYYANDEKLLVSDFVNNGSLQTALHGGSSSPSPILPWASRLKIAQGVARGLAHIHEKNPHKYVHGNLKSSKILLGDDLHPYISGFGLTRLISGTPKISITSLKQQNLNHSILKGLKVPGTSVVYSAPETRYSGSKFTQKCDVYSFGIILLEILTGKMPDAGPENNEDELESFVRKVFREKRPMSEIIDPSLFHEVYAKKQVVAAFHVALNCTELDPEVRPRMRYVSESLDRISLQ